MEPVDKEGKPRTLYFDTDCLNYLEDKWSITKKTVIISAPSFSLSPDNCTITPLERANKNGTHGAKWKKAYQALKHDRINSLEQATIRNLLYALGALYILNLYYKNEVIPLWDSFANTKQNIQAGSSIFSTCLYHANNIDLSVNMCDGSINNYSGENRENAIYIVKFTNKDFKAIHQKICEDLNCGLTKFTNPHNFKKFLDAHQQFKGPDFEGKTPAEIAALWGDTNIILEYSDNSYLGAVRIARLVAVLNKEMDIYPKLISAPEKISLGAGFHSALGLNFRS